jgi:hypothetical protein
VSQDKPEDSISLCAECETHAEFSGALADRVGQQALDTGDGDHKSCKREEAEESYCEDLVAERAVDDLLHSLDIVQRGIGLEVMYGAAEFAIDGVGGQGRANGYVHE